jgi:hypothetical protein
MLPLSNTLNSIFQVVVVWLHFCDLRNFIANRLHLATLPTQDVDKAINSQHMLEKTGQLALPELVVATNEIKPYTYAQLLLKKHVSIDFCIHYV